MAICFKLFDYFLFLQQGYMDSVEKPLSHEFEQFSKARSVSSILFGLIGETVSQRLAFGQGHFTRKWAAMQNYSKIKQALHSCKKFYRCE